VGIQRPQRRFAGFGTAEHNREVEEAALRFVTQRYQAQGWEVFDVSGQHLGYDLRCTRGAEEAHIEVKGVAGTVPTFLLTENERQSAATDPLWGVAVVTGALEPSPELLEVGGAELLASWRLDPVTWRVSRPVQPT
jgi:hypothetical protein